MPYALAGSPPAKSGGPAKKTRLSVHGTEKVTAVFALHVIAYDLIPLGYLLSTVAIEAA